MKNLLHFIVSAASLIFFTGCKTMYVGVEHAQTSGGYVNTSMTQIGTLFVVDSTDAKKPTLTSLVVQDVSPHPWFFNRSNR